MAKRFIDTGLFDDEWYMDLSKDGKLLYLYLITKCSHAGLIKLNERLCKVQTGITDLKGALKDLGNRLVTVQEGFFFMPKFLYFQYPNFPNSKVFQQKTALDELIKIGLFDNTSLTLKEGFINPTVYVNDNVDDNANENESKYPSLKEFTDYAVSNKPDININALVLKYKAWVENGWKDGNNKKIANWKSKLLNTLPYIKEGAKQEKKNLYQGYKDSSFD